MLEYDEATLASLELTFVATITSMFGEAVERELLPGGGDVKVTRANVHQYVDLYADFLLNKSIQKSVKPLFLNFYGKLLERFWILKKIFKI